MKILHLTVKKKWFDMIASGEKKEEYREIKPYWSNRLAPFVDAFAPDDEFEVVRFRNGYNKDSPTILLECKGIEIGKARPEWSDNWPGNVFVIKLGKILPP